MIGHDNCNAVPTAQGSSKPFAERIALFIVTLLRKRNFVFSKKTTIYAFLSPANLTKNLLIKLGRSRASPGSGPVHHEMGLDFPFVPMGILFQTVVRID